MQAAYDPATDFEPIGMVATLSLVILTQAAARSKPRRSRDGGKSRSEEISVRDLRQRDAPHFAARC